MFWGEQDSWSGLERKNSFFKKKKEIVFIYLWRHWVFMVARVSSQVAASWLLMAGAPLVAGWTLGPLGSGAVVHGLRCSVACGIFTDQGSWVTG